MQLCIFKIKTNFAEIHKLVFFLKKAVTQCHKYPMYTEIDLYSNKYIHFTSLIIHRH